MLEIIECKIDGKTQKYYKSLEPIVVFYYKFKDGEQSFIILTGKHQGDYRLKDSGYSLINFQSIKQLSIDNNHTFDLEKFLLEYGADNGNYYTYNKYKKSFSIINDDILLHKIKKEMHEYELNETNDIKKMFTTIKKTIISQDEQIMQILTSLFKNQKVINSSLDKDLTSKLKENILIYGSTGTGKTEILKRIASIYNVPIVIEDATSLSETDFVGRDITDVLEDLYLESGKDMKIAEKGILVIDEFDKLAEKKNTNSDHVSRIGVQRSLLKLLDGSTFYFNDKNFNTSKLSVVALGAFTEDDYKNMNVEFSYNDDFIDYIANKAIELKSGARSLKTLFDSIISDAMFEIFAEKYTKINLFVPKSDRKLYTLSKK